MVTSLVGYATQVKTKPFSIWPSSKNDWSLWSVSPDSNLPAHDEHAPARQEYGRSMPASSAASKMYVSSPHSISCSPSGVFNVTLKACTLKALAARIGRAADRNALVAEGALIDTRRPPTRVIEVDAHIVEAISASLWSRVGSKKVEMLVRARFCQAQATG